MAATRSKTRSKTGSKTGTRYITMKHLTVTLWNVQLACEAIRRVLESMDPDGMSQIVLPRREGRLIKRMDTSPKTVITKCCPPPPDPIRRGR